MLNIHQLQRQMSLHTFQSIRVNATIMFVAFKRKCEKYIPSRFGPCVNYSRNMEHYTFVDLFESKFQLDAENDSADRFRSNWSLLVLLNN